MAELATIARPYAEALFHVAKAGNLKLWSESISEMVQLAGHPDVKTFVTNPKVPKQQISDTFLSLVTTNKGSPELKNFISMLVENDRLILLPEISEQFHALKNAEEGAADAEITSAFELNDAQVRDLVATLEKKFGRKLNPWVTVDNSLIGGVRVVVGDQVLDTSVRAKLQKMHTALTA